MPVAVTAIVRAEGVRLTATMTRPTRYDWLGAHGARRPAEVIESPLARLPKGHDTTRTTALT